MSLSSDSYCVLLACYDHRKCRCSVSGRYVFHICAWYGSPTCHRFIHSSGFCTMPTPVTSIQFIYRLTNSRDICTVYLPVDELSWHRYHSSTGWRAPVTSVRLFTGWRTPVTSVPFIYRLTNSRDIGTVYLPVDELPWHRYRLFTGWRTPVTSVPFIYRLTNSRDIGTVYLPVDELPWHRYRLFTGWRTPVTSFICRLTNYRDICAVYLPVDEHPWHRYHLSTGWRTPVTTVPFVCRLTNSRDNGSVLGFIILSKVAVLSGSFVVPEVSYITALTTRGDCGTWRYRRRCCIRRATAKRSMTSPSNRTGHWLSPGTCALWHVTLPFGSVRVLTSAFSCAARIMGIVRIAFCGLFIARLCVRYLWLPSLMLTIICGLFPWLFTADIAFLCFVLSQ